jgi:hypothetical protein
VTSRPICLRSTSTAGDESGTRAAPAVGFGGAAFADQSVEPHQIEGVVYRQPGARGVQAFTKTPLSEPRLEARMSALAAHLGKSKFSCKRHCDRRVAGRTQPTDGEGTWTFTPNAPWRACPYRLVVLGTLEDSAGNRLGSHFETSIDSPPGLPVDAVISLAGSRC